MLDLSSCTRSISNRLLSNDHSSRLRTHTVSCRDWGRQLLTIHVRTDSHLLGAGQHDLNLGSMLGIRNSACGSGGLKDESCVRADHHTTGCNYLSLSLGPEAIQLVQSLQHVPLHVLVLTQPSHCQSARCQGHLTHSWRYRWHLLLGQGTGLFPVTVCTSWGQWVEKMALIWAA